jgi:23S rRNA pseudouridine1911/1915/1917 synthase
MKTSLSVVFENDDILVVNKPYSLIVHPKNKDDTQPSLVDWVENHYPNLKNVGEPFSASGHPVPRYGIVHRLDKDTSGLLIIAKNQEIFDYLKDLFKTRKIAKHYLALVHGKLDREQGTIKSPLGRIGIKRTTQIKGKKLIDEKEARTDYKVIKKYDRYSLLELSPKTGRTHQLRVHLKSIGHPVTGDFVYGFTKVPNPPGLTRLFLHAYKLSFSLPSGEALNIECDLPESLQKTLNMLE